MILPTRRMLFKQHRPSPYHTHIIEHIHANDVTKYFF